MPGGWPEDELVAEHRRRGPPEHERSGWPESAVPPRHRTPPPGRGGGPPEPAPRPPSYAWSSHEEAIERQRYGPSDALEDPASEPERLPPMMDLDPDPPRQLDAWSAYEEVHRSRSGPDPQTEPDAPVSRRKAPLANWSDSVPDAPPFGELVTGPMPIETLEPPEPPEPDDDELSESSRERRSVSIGRRPPRPRATEPRDRGMLRGRAPARPGTPNPRQPDAPSLRRALRPTRDMARVQQRDETATKKYPAGQSPKDEPSDSDS